MTIENNTILIYYPVATGGKFFINSLGLSRHCVLHHVDLAKWDCSQSNFDQHYYQTKLDYVLKTVPPGKDAPWQQFELGVGNSWISLIENPPTASSELEDIVNADRHCCVIAHDPQEVDAIKSSFPNLKNIIKLTNYTKWLAECSFKVSGLAEDIKNKVDYWGYIDRKEIENPPYNYFLVDVDNCMRDQNLMTERIQKLYQHLGFDDFNKDLWLQYYTKYINFHNALQSTSNT